MSIRKIGTKIATIENINIPEEFESISLKINEHKMKTYSFTQNHYPYSYKDNDEINGENAPAGILLNDLASLYYTSFDPDTNMGFHTDEELVFHSPAKIGEKVTLTGSYTDKYQKNGKNYVVMDCEALGEDGRKLITRRGIEIFGAETGAEKKKSNRTKKKVNKENVITGKYDKKLKVIENSSQKLEIGHPIKFLRKKITPEQTSVYSFAGDYLVNIHNNIQVARNAGLEFPVIQALQQVGYILEMLTDFFGEDWQTSGRLKVKFIKPVRSDAVIMTKGVIKEIDKTVNQKTLKLEVWTEDQHQDMTVVGWASADID